MLKIKELKLLREVKGAQNRKIPFRLEKFTVKILPKAIYRFSEIPIKIPIAYFLQKWES